MCSVCGEGSEGGVMSDLQQGLSAVMIVRNGEKYLSLVLRALARVVDEIVLVDTGSTDRTLEIARRQGCRVLEFAWCNDFSRAKNFGIEHARYSWILSVDADEVLYGQEIRERLAAPLAAPDIPAYIIWVDNLFDSGRVEPSRMLRLFRNDPRIRFVNPVHESIGEALYAHWPHITPPVLDIHLRHYGYLSGNAAGKHDRNIALLKEWADTAPDNIYANYKLGGTLAESGRRGEALPYLKRTFDLVAGCGDRGTYPFVRTFANLYLQLLAEEGLAEDADRCRKVAAGWG